MQINQTVGIIGYPTGNTRIVWIRYRPKVLAGVGHGIIAEFVEPAKQLSDTSSVRDALAPKDYAMSFTVDYEAVMADIAALQAVLSWHYKRQVEVLRAEDDDDSVIALLM